jgi:hypothetical protein
VLADHQHGDDHTADDRHDDGPDDRHHDASDHCDDHAAADHLDDFNCNNLYAHGYYIHTAHRGRRAGRRDDLRRGRRRRRGR